VFFADPMFVSQRRKIAELASTHRVPTVFPRRENVDAGGLIAYGPNLASQFHKAAHYVDRIFRGKARRGSRSSCPPSSSSSSTQKPRRRSASYCRSRSCFAPTTWSSSRPRRGAKLAGSPDRLEGEAMASVVHETPYHDRRIQERRRVSRPVAVHAAEGVRVSWGGIFGGVLSALGLLLLLAALGVAIGISAVDPGELRASTLGTGAGIWAGVSLLLALFLGGLVATRIGAISDRTTAFFEGALVWVVTVLLMGYLATSGIGTVAGGVFNMLGGATQAVGSVMQAGSADVDLSGSVDQMMQRLRDPNTAQQIAAATRMPRFEVEKALSEAAQRVQQARDNPAQAAAEARQRLAQLVDQAKSSGALQQKAEQIQPQASRAAWITLGALLLSLLAAVIGAMAGRRRAPVV